jgi:hypothetical protein
MHVAAKQLTGLVLKKGRTAVGLDQSNRAHRKLEK